MDERVILSIFRRSTFVSLWTWKIQTFPSISFVNTNLSNVCQPPFPFSVPQDKLPRFLFTIFSVPSACSDSLLINFPRSNIAGVIHDEGNADFFGIDASTLGIRNEIRQRNKDRPWHQVEQAPEHFNLPRSPIKA